MLPFPRAHWYVAAFFVLTFAAFTPSYFGVLRQAPWVHHLHGVTATLWIVLIMTQNLSAHRGRWKLHAWSGRASLPLCPLFTVGGLLVTQHTLLEDNLFKELFGVALSAADIVASVAFVVFYTLALAYRRNPDLHARFMLSTIILLIGPSLSRFFANFVPGFLVRSAETLPKFGAALDASFMLIAAFCLWLIFRDFQNNKPLMPFISALIATAGMAVGYYAVGPTSVYGGIASWIAALPVWQIVVFGLVASGSAVVWGWISPFQTSRLHSDPLFTD